MFFLRSSSGDTVFGFFEARPPLSRWSTTTTTTTRCVVAVELIDRSASGSSDLASREVSMYIDERREKTFAKAVLNVRGRID